MTKNKPTTQAPAPPPKKSYTWLYALIGIASVLIILQSLGIFKSIDRSQSTGWMDLKSAEYENRKMPERRPEKPNPNVDATLQEIASEFQGKIFTDIRTANTEKGWGLSDDEAKFYDEMRERYSHANTNWLGLVKRSYSTYKIVKEIFGGSTDAVSMLQDARKAAAIYNEIQSKFGIPAIESQNFAETSKGRSLSDWAYFIESKISNR